MSLHFRARDYLFESFIQRSYKDEKLKSQLLKFHPDQILSLKSELEKNERFRHHFKKLTEHLAQSPRSARLENLVRFLQKCLKKKYAFLLSYLSPLDKYKKQHLQGIFGKPLKTWQPNAFQTMILFHHRFHEGPLKFQPSEREDFFEKIGEAFELYPINTGKTHYGYLALSPGELNLLSREFLSLVVCLLIEQYDFQLESTERARVKRLLDTQVKFTEKLMSELKSSAGMDASMFSVISKRLDFDPWILFKKEKGKFQPVLSSGIRGFKPIALPFKKELAKTGSLDFQTLSYVKKYLAPFSYVPKSLFAAPVPMASDHVVFFFDLKKSLFYEGQNILANLIFRMGASKSITPLSRKP